MTNEDWRYWPDAGLIVMGLAAIVALAIAVSGYFSSDSEISAARFPTRLRIVVGGCGRRSLVADPRRRFAWLGRAFCRPVCSRSSGNLDCGLSA
jgi:hypothetical protein